MAATADAPVIAGQQDIDGGEVAAPPLDAISVVGSTTLGPTFGGKAPLSATLSLKGGKIEVRDGTAFDKGDVIRLEVIAVVREVSQKDKVDKPTQLVVDCVQHHGADVTDVRLLEVLQD